MMDETPTLLGMRVRKLGGLIDRSWKTHNGTIIELLSNIGAGREIVKVKFDCSDEDEYYSVYLDTLEFI